MTGPSGDQPHGRSLDGYHAGSSFASRPVLIRLPSLSVLLSALWTLALLLALVEPKQLDFLLPGVHWYYPDLLLLVVIAIACLLSEGAVPKLSGRLYRICLPAAAFATIYLATAALNLALSPSADTNTLMDGVGRVTLQYLIAPPLLCYLISRLFRNRRAGSALSSFVAPSLIEIGVFVAGLAIAFGSAGSGIASTIREEVLGQSWVLLGSTALFVPKWGATYAESQELGLFLFLSFLLLDLYAEVEARGTKSGYRYLRLAYLALIVLTASKGVAAGLLVYILLRTRRNFQFKISALVLAVIGLSWYVVYSVVHDPVAFHDAALSYGSLDERVFHIMYFFGKAAARPIHLLIGFGARQHGRLVARDYPSSFGEFGTPVSMFAIVTDAGFAGLGCYTILVSSIWRSLGGYRARLALCSSIIADLWMPDWSMEIFVLYLLILAVAGGRHSEEENGFSEHSQEAGKTAAT